MACRVVIAYNKQDGRIGPRPAKPLGTRPSTALQERATGPPRPPCIRSLYTWRAERLSGSQGDYVEKLVRDGAPAAGKPAMMAALGGPAKNDRIENVIACLRSIAK
jgi:hypothetical protein